MVLEHQSMSKPQIFISSTFYDQKQARADLNNFIKQLVYETVKNYDTKSKVLIVLWT